VNEASRRLPTARALAREAGEKVMVLLQEPLVRERKSDRSLVTNADHAANDILRRGLRAAFPMDRVLSEETGTEGPVDAFLTWLVDPLDGTKAYARGEAGFSVMVGLLREGKPVLGVVFDPREGVLYEAVRGEGAFAEYADGRRERLRVSARADWRRRPVVASPGLPEALRKRVRETLGCPFIADVNSVGVKVGRLVRGLADIYLNPHPVNVWDTAGPLVILEEAGGRMTHWDGSSLVYAVGSPRHAGPTLATNGPGHDEFLRILQSRRSP
jgi:3'(2'), 5'-bisphosphate nucleotidase